MTVERPANGRHRVELGDDLRSLAERYYGDPERWTRLWAANRAVLANRTSLTPGLALSIPAEADLPVAGEPTGREPDGKLGPDGRLTTEDDQGTVAGWPGPPAAPAETRTRRRFAVRRAGPREANRPVKIALAVILPLLLIGSCVALSEGPELVRQRTVATMPGVLSVDGDNRRVRLDPEISVTQARRVLDEVFWLKESWMLYVGTESMVVTRSWPYDRPDLLYETLSKTLHDARR